MGLEFGFGLGLGLGLTSVSSPPVESSLPALRLLISACMPAAPSPARRQVSRTSERRRSALLTRFSSASASAVSVCVV